MSVTKNTLLIFLLVIIAVLFMYLYSGPVINTIVKDKFNFRDWPGKNYSGWIATLITFSIGVGTGWLLFRRAK